MKTQTIEQKNIDIYAAAANMSEYDKMLDELLDDIDNTDEALWSAGNGKLWLNEYHFGKRLADAAKKWHNKNGEHIKDFRERFMDWLFTNNEPLEE